ncbi:MAG: bifunctional 4-hydroxy-2-oxoglutarate aldolase/2-dehydro-3-deoxy-phosphogluconate aldolase [Deltaproteobacteria bacterium]|nr:bifunctional 4-hydroxy-2-oxoglutarate aldolase/2-dehydro-3-deoxy-phosphogluconate aldolase [Deltaproteobacteria bacterium]
MAQAQWKIQALEILQAGPVVPVMVIDKLAHAVPLARALVAGGVRVLEIVLRTPVAIDAIRAIVREVPQAITGAGTVLNGQDLRAVTEAGAVFAISPGLTRELLDAALQGPIALIPGIATISELMLGLDKGYQQFKFFPAEAAGGIAMLKAIGGPFPQATFCPTGGISAANYRDYLALKNVACVGGSWIVASDLIEAQNWRAITELAAKTIAAAGRS